MEVGCGFRPYEEELVGYFLRHMIQGNIHLVQDFISEVNICNFDPHQLRLQSKIRSRDQYSYFFCKRESKYSRGDQQSRQTPSGKWKITGKPSDVKDQWGIWCGVRGVIGFKRVLSFKKDSSQMGTKTEWGMHEFHYTLLPESQRTYVVCRLEYKGDDENIILGNPTQSFGSVVEQPGHGSFNNPLEVDSANQALWWCPADFDMPQLQANSGYINNLREVETANQAPWVSNNLDLQPQALYGDESQVLWNSVVEENLDFLVDQRTYMQNFSNHRPRSPVRGVLAGYSSDGDTDSMICGDTTSSTDSVGSSSGSWRTPRDDILSLNTTERSIGSEDTSDEEQEQPKQLKLQLQGKEKVIDMQKSECEWKMAEDSVKKAPSTIAVKQSWIVWEKMNQKNSKWNYLKNMIIGILLFVSITGWIIWVG